MSNQTKKAIGQYGKNISGAVRASQAWAAQVFTQWQGDAAAASAAGIEAFYTGPAAEYLKALDQCVKKAGGKQDGA